ncbi:hypothetical protein [Bacillus sp. FSL K6-2839]|uniref:hypothetical protein n=1 Tax=Bacillus sp. FSL K6-2839 TaxID=2921480 RepID=UPI0030F7948B
MKLKKSDWMLIREATEKGLLVSMTNLVERKRTELNEQLSDYFRKQMPGYTGSFDEDQAENILDSVNNFIAEKNLDAYQLDFPLSSGTDNHLIPITDNLDLKVTVADEYYGDGDYSKYVMADSFIINEKANEEDVDELIKFIKKRFN